MAVTLTIENETSLPDGGPLSYVIAGKRGIDIGRDSFLDWALPDPTKKDADVKQRTTQFTGILNTIKGVAEAK